MFELLKLKPRWAHRPLGLDALADEIRHGGLSDMCDVPVEVGSLEAVADMLATGEQDDPFELHERFEEAIAAHGVARHGEYVIRRMASPYTDGEV